MGSHNALLRLSRDSNQTDKFEYVIYLKYKIDIMQQFNAKRSMIQINENKCVGCGYCEVNCPFLAINVLGLAKINMDKCEKCMKCITVCPKNSILMM